MKLVNKNRYSYVSLFHCQSIRFHLPPQMGLRKTSKKKPNYGQTEQRQSAWSFRRTSKPKCHFEGQESATWSYWSSLNGPHQWPMLFSQARGIRQSPVVISEKKSVYDPFLSDSGYQFDYKREPCVLMNDGAGWVIKFGEMCSSNVRFTRTNDVYRLYEIRCHWGSNGHQGAEHKVGDYEDVGEIQIVHYNQKYGSFGEAIQYKDGLSIFSVLLEEDAYDNQILDNITDLMNKIMYKNSSLPLLHGFDATQLIPDKRYFWTYEGSMTMPPCNECVVWTIFRDTLPISARQLETFRSIYAIGLEQQSTNCQQKIVNNIRPVQPLNGRMIRCSFRSGAMCNYSWD